MLIAERVDAVLRRQLGDGVEWDSRTSLTDQRGLALDSLDLVELVMGLEEEFGLEIPDDVIWATGWVVSPRYETVGQLADYIDRRLAEKPALFGLPA